VYIKHGSEWYVLMFWSKRIKTFFGWIFRHK